MRTKEEVRKMLGKAVNAASEGSGRTKEHRMKKDILYAVVQSLDWVLVSDESELTEKLEKRIETLIEES